MLARMSADTPPINPALPSFLGGVPHEQQSSDDPRDISPGYAVPHVLMADALIKGTAQSYFREQWDEAMRHDRVNAMAMRLDEHLQACLRERRLGVTRLNWHLETDNSKRDPREKLLCDGLTRAAKATRSLIQFQENETWANWYGRYGNQVQWAWQPLRMPQIAPLGQTNDQPMRTLVMDRFEPVNGDKIEWTWDGTPMVRINGSYASRFPDADVVYDNLGASLVLRGSWRQRFIFHKVYILDGDADFHDAQGMGSVNGNGLRSFLYWNWWLQNEAQTAIHDALERYGLGFIVIYFTAGDAKSEEEAKNVAKRYSRRSVLLVPRLTDGRAAEGIQVVETPTAGITALMELMQQYRDRSERAIIGQTMSSSRKGGGGALGDSGAAEMQTQTKADIIADDALKLAETLTGSDRDIGLISMLKQHNYPWASDIPVRWVYDIPDPRAKEKLDAVKTTFDMGVDFSKDEARGLTGMSKPESNDEVIGKTQQMQLQAQLDLQQAQQLQAAGVDPGAIMGSGDKNGDGPPSKNGKPSSNGNGKHDDVPAFLKGGRFQGEIEPELYQLTARELNEAASKAMTDPTEDQKKSGNYTKGHCNWKGLPLTIENAKGSFRRGKSADGKAWQTKMTAHYGYFKRTESEADGDHIDFFIKPEGVDSELVCIVNQINPKTGKFDEHKVILGCASEAEAKALYLSNYSKGWQGFDSVACMTLDQFKEWLQDGDSSKPVHYAFNPNEARDNRGEWTAGGAQAKPPYTPDAARAFYDSAAFMTQPEFDKGLAGFDALKGKALAEVAAKLGMVGKVTREKLKQFVSDRRGGSQRAKLTEPPGHKEKPTVQTPAPEQPVKPAIAGPTPGMGTSAGFLFQADLTRQALLADLQAAFPEPDEPEPVVYVGEPLPPQQPAPVIHVHVPEIKIPDFKFPAPVVHFTAPEINIPEIKMPKLPAPAPITVTLPEIKIPEQPAAVITVNIPEIKLPEARGMKKTIVRGKDGEIKEVIETPEK
jgi:hypothetical protein